MAKLIMKRFVQCTYKDCKTYRDFWKKNTFWISINQNVRS